jgi:hypothetical protein
MKETGHLKLSKKSRFPISGNDQPIRPLSKTNIIEEATIAATNCQFLVMSNYLSAC